MASLLTAMSITSNAKLSDPMPVQLKESATVSMPSCSTTEADYRLSPSKEVMMNLSGTTPLKNWAMSAHGLNGDARMAVTKDDRLVEIRALSFSLPVLNLKGEQRAMDEDAYKALKADQYKDITFKLTSATVEPQCENHYNVEALGNLTVAGVTRTVVLKMRSQVSRDGSITFTGSENVKMSDYNVCLLYTSDAADE